MFVCVCVCIIIVRPKVSIQNKYVSVNLGYQLEVDCFVEAFPKADSYWFKSSTGSAKNLVPQMLRAELNGKWSHYSQNAELRSPTMISSRSSHDDNEPAIATDRETNGDHDEEEGERGALFYPRRKLFLWQNNNNNTDLGRARPFVERRRGHNRHEVRQVEHFGADMESRYTTQKRTVLMERMAPRTAFISVKQTALNPYTYKLRLTIAKMQADDYGDYVCSASNSMGSSQAHTIVTSELNGLISLYHIFLIE